MARRTAAPATASARPASEPPRAVGMLDTAGNADVRWCNWSAHFSLLPTHLTIFQDACWQSKISCTSKSSATRHGHGRTRKPHRAQSTAACTGNASSCARPARCPGAQRTAIRRARCVWGACLAHRSSLESMFIDDVAHPTHSQPHQPRCHWTAHSSPPIFLATLREDLARLT